MYESAKMVEWIFQWTHRWSSDGELRVRDGAFGRVDVLPEDRSLTGIRVFSRNNVLNSIIKRIK